MSRRMAMRSGGWTALALAVAVSLGACGSDATVTAPVAESVPDLDGILLVAIQDEYHAEATYAGVLEDFGPVVPFSNIIEAEERHSSAIAHLYAVRAWAVPTSDWTLNNVSRFESLQEACAVGVVAEIANIAVYDELLAAAGLPSDVAQVFASNRRASLERHLQG